MESSVGTAKDIISNVMKLYTFENENRAKVDSYILSHIEDIYVKGITAEIIGNDLQVPSKGKGGVVSIKSILREYMRLVEKNERKIKLFSNEIRLADGMRAILFSCEVKSMLKPMIEPEIEKKMKEEIILDFTEDAVEPVECVQTKIGNSDPEAIPARELIGIYKWFATQKLSFGANCAFNASSLDKSVNIYQAYVKMLDIPRYKNILAMINSIFSKNSVDIPHILRSYKIVNDVVELIKWCVDTETNFNDVDYINENATIFGKFSKVLFDSAYAHDKTISGYISRRKPDIVKAIESYRETIKAKGLSIFKSPKGDDIDCLESFTDERRQQKE